MTKLQVGVIARLLSPPWRSPDSCSCAAVFCVFVVGAGTGGLTLIYPKPLPDGRSCAAVFHVVEVNAGTGGLTFVNPKLLPDGRSCTAVFRVLEVGAGAGGLTKDALPLLDDGLNAELLTYTATDITSAPSSSLLDAVRSPKLQCKVGQLVANAQCSLFRGAHQLE